jgi:hypothetical protein
MKGEKNELAQIHTSSIEHLVVCVVEDFPQPVVELGLGLGRCCPEGGNGCVLVRWPRDPSSELIFIFYDAMCLNTMHLKAHVPPNPLSCPV